MGLGAGAAWGTNTGTAFSAPVAKSGAGDIGDYTEMAGEDGHASMRKGVAWPNPRFTDNSNGTVTDNLTGLIWLKDANAFGYCWWGPSLSECAALSTGEHGLTDGSADGDWRLPNVKELQSLIDYGHSNPVLCNTAGTGQWTTNDPFTSIEEAGYWLSTTHPSDASLALVVSLIDGNMSYIHKSIMRYVWPVRGGE